jgi:hypothetical protein
MPRVNPHNTVRDSAIARMQRACLLQERSIPQDVSNNFPFKTNLVTPFCCSLQIA